MNNCAGVGRDVIVSKEAFEMLVRASMQQLHGPTQQCLSMVTRELLQLAQGAEPAEVLRCGTPLRLPVRRPSLPVIAQDARQPRGSSGCTAVRGSVRCDLSDSRGCGRLQRARRRVSMFGSGRLALRKLGAALAGTRTCISRWRAL